MHRLSSVPYRDRTRAVRELAALGPHLPPAVLAHLSAMCGDGAAARRHAEESSRLGGTPLEQRLMFEQIERLLGEPRRRR